MKRPYDVRRGPRPVGVLLALVVALSGLGSVAAPAVAAQPNGQLCGPAGGASDSLKITGWVTADRTYDKAALDALPQTTVADSYLAGSGTTQANYTGVDLAALLELPTASGGIGTYLRPSSPTGPQGATQRNDITRYSVMVTGSDCFQATFAMTELSPYFGGKPVVVATAQGAYAPSDLTPVTGSLGTSGFARISNPVDARGSRRISNIVEIRVFQAPLETTTPPTQSPTCTPGPSTSLTVDGFVTAPQSYDKAALDALPQTTVADSYLAGSGTTQANYTGVELWRLLGLSATDGGVGPLIKPNSPGPQAPLPQKNDLTRYSVMVTATDCFQALYSLAEISPYFGGKPVLVATAQGAYDPADLTPVNGSLDTAGFARLSNPVDVRGSRRVSNIVEIRVLPTPTPTVTWPTPAPIFAGTPLSTTQLNATASYGGAAVPGTFTYDLPAGTVLPVGTYTLSGLFVPTSPGSTTIARGVTTLRVLPVRPPGTTALARSADATVTAGDVTTVSTRLTSGSAALTGEIVQLLARPAGAADYALLALVTTGPDGRAAYVAQPVRTTSYRWRFPARGANAASESDAATVQVRTAVSLDLRRAGDEITAKGRTLPAKPGTKVVLWRKTADGRSRIGRDKVDGKGRFSIDVDLSAGRYRLFVTVKGDDANLAGTSPIRRVRLTRG